VNSHTTDTGGSALVREIVYVVFKRKTFLIALTVLAVVLIAYGILTDVPRYQATAAVMIRRLPQAYTMPTESRAVLRRGEVINSEIEIIRSAAVAGRVADALGVEPGRDRALFIEKLQKQVRARTQPESNIIEINFTHVNRERAALVTNAVLDAYLEVRKTVNFDYEAVEYLDEQAHRIRGVIDSIAAEIADVGGEEGILTIDLRGQQQMDLIGRFLTEATELDRQITLREEQLEVLGEWLATSDDLAVVPSVDIYNEPAIVKLKESLITQRVQLAQARARYTNGHPEVLRMERQVASAESLMRYEVSEAYDRMGMRLAEWRMQRAAVQEVIDQLRAEEPGIAENNIKLRLLEHEMSIRTDLYAVLLSRREQFRITAATDPNLLSVGVVARASVPATPVTAAVNMTVVVAVFTFFFGVLLIFGMERLDHSLERREDVERLTGLKVLASIPDRGAS
jgi:uncharacterized protein involved in exopolysaccharide biosynthesis